jgi:hypothetical protein
MVNRYLKKEAEEPRQRGLQTGEYVIILGMVAVFAVVIMMGTTDQLHQHLEQVARAFNQAP